MRDTREHLLDIIESAGVDILCSLPCDRIKEVIAGASSRGFLHLPLTREEEGVGISAGAALAGRKPAMLIQNSGVGNMVNALLSLTVFYELPLAIFISHRGVYKEAIQAQVPMGEALPALLDAMGIGYSLVSNAEELGGVQDEMDRLYSEGRVHAFLLSPALWEMGEGDCSSSHNAGHKPDEPASPCAHDVSDDPPPTEHEKPAMRRYEAIKSLKGYLEGQIVICNIGLPSKELYEVLDQPSNFYMLGSMGMATPIGLGVALFTSGKVFVIDGDGSLLMNPGTLATVAGASPANLAIIAIDNSAYGSTGSQPTLTGTCVDLEQVARGFGLRNTVKAAGAKEIKAAMHMFDKGPAFVHLLAVSGNQAVSNIPLDRLEIKKRFQDFLTA